ncbi:MAG: ABC transporter ATP-binding protein [Halofilum sp. (in: g-proteobacteria)]|nr:ABC transporter ATP-binding protein [Halofilum sp. (in: g-proteobacteria)]
MSADDGNVLEVRDLSLDFGSARGRVHALRHVNLTVPRGRIVGLVGESGSGKSTLAVATIGLLAGNAEVVGGEILFEGRDVLKMSERELRAIRGRRASMIFQDPMTALNPVRSIATQMTDIQYRDGISDREKRRRAVEMLSRVGIPDPENRIEAFPHQFSGGMRQRICIAMALLAEPALLLADEPTTALDATLEVQIIGLLRRLQEEIGCSILFVSHHLGTVAELCDDVVVMYAGEVIERGSVGDVFHNPAHPYTHALIECDPGRIKEKTRQLPTIPGEVPDSIHVPAGCVFRDRCPRAFERCAREWPPEYVANEDRQHYASCHLLDRDGEAGQ